MLGSTLRRPRFSLTLALVAAAFLNQNSMSHAVILTPGYGTLTQFTGGDSGEGLDLIGTFALAYALGRTSGSANVRGVTFTAPGAAVTHGVSGGGTLQYSPLQSGVLGQDYGDSPNDNALESLLDYAVYGRDVRIELATTVGATYQLQLILNEPYRPAQSPRSTGAQYRIFDIYHEQDVPGGGLGITQNVKVLSSYNPGLDTNGSKTAGADFGLVYTYIFTARDNFFNIRLLDLPGSDVNAVMAALTLEVIGVPEPSTAGLFILGAVSLLRVRRRIARQ